MTYNNTIYRSLLDWVNKKEYLEPRVVVDPAFYEFLPSCGGSYALYERGVAPSLPLRAPSSKVNETVARRLGGPRPRPTGRGGVNAAGAVPSSSPALLTGGAISKEDAAPLPSVPSFAGFDGGCELTLSGVWFPDDEEKRKEFFLRLDSLRSESCAFAESINPTGYCISFGGVVFELLPYGSKGKTAFARYKFQLRAGGLTILISSFNTEENNVRLIFGYDSLVDSDLFQAYEKARGILVKAGFVLSCAKLARVDLQATLGVPFEVVQRAFDNNCVVSRVRRWSFHSDNRSSGRQLLTVRGGGDLQICLYDKFAACRDKHELDKLEDCYNLSDRENNYFFWTRVEYRLKGEFLKAAGVQLIDDFKQKLPDLIEYLTGAWFRILGEGKKRGQENAQEVSNFWRDVQNAFRRGFCNGVVGKKEGITLKRNKTRVVKDLVDQGAGCLTSALASSTCSGKRLTYNQFVFQLMKLVTDSGPEYYQDYCRKFIEEKVSRSLCDSVDALRGVSDDPVDPLALPVDLPDRSPLSGPDHSDASRDVDDVPPVRDDFALPPSMPSSVGTFKELSFAAAADKRYKDEFELAPEIADLFFEDSPKEGD